MLFDIEKIKKGYKLKRDEWLEDSYIKICNIKDMNYLFLENEKDLYICIINKDSKNIWYPSVIDLLAEDWRVVK